MAFTVEIAFSFVCNSCQNIGLTHEKLSQFLAVVIRVGIVQCIPLRNTDLKSGHEGLVHFVATSQRLIRRDWPKECS